MRLLSVPSLFFSNDPPTTEIYTLSLHDALPIFPPPRRWPRLRSCRSAPPHTSCRPADPPHPARPSRARAAAGFRSEEHTSELQSHSDLVCRLLLEKKKKKKQLNNSKNKQKTNKK